MSRPVTFTAEALAACTPAQLQALVDMNTEESGTLEIAVFRGGLGLPVSYLAFRREFAGASIYGGIAPDGSVST